MAIKRIWHGWTAREHADPYQELLHREIFPGIESRGITGYRSVELFRRDLEDEVEFITIMTFDSLKSVIQFVGKDYEQCYVPEPARKLLKRWDLKAVHFTAVEKRDFRL
jgi:hypothetical protein